MSTLKERKEQFVSGLTGGEIGEINLVTSVAVTGYLLWSIINSNTYLFKNGNKWDSFSLVTDFLLNWLGLLLSITIYSDYPLFLTFALVIPTISISLLFKKTSIKLNQEQKSHHHHSQDLTIKEYLPKKSFITAYRGGMLIVTALAILAVDFNVFPRRFAKVETWGTSLMDLGVGSFVFSMGIVTTRSLLVEKFNNVKQPYLSKLRKSIFSSFSVLALGFSRLFFVKNLDYQEHVTEYGVHWNFFITLVLVGPLSIFLDPIFNYIPRFIVSFLISLIYEWFITQKEGFLTFLLLSPRTDFISANREGLFSLFGYLAIFLAGQSAGYYVLPSIVTKNNLYKLSTKEEIIKNEKIKWTKFDKFTSFSPITGLAVLCVTYTLLFKFVLAEHHFNVSRRLANLPYVLWVCAYNTGFLMLYALIDKFILKDEDVYENKISVSLDAINSNGMILFLLSNVSTGLTNLTFNTLDASPVVSMTILITYAAFIAVVGGFLYYKKIFIKI